MAKKTGLGKGLDSLISPKGADRSAFRKPVAQEKPEGVEEKIAISLISPNRNQPRKTFEEGALKELADSIKEHGIIQPLILRKEGKGYEIIAGERRFRAAQMVGLKEVPAIVRNYTEKERNEIALIENIQRENLNPIEEALAYEELIKKYGLKQEELAVSVSKSRTAITNRMRLLNLPKNVQTFVIEGKLSEGHARAILSTPTKEAQEKLAKLVIDRKLSVRQTEELAKKTSPNKKPATKKKVDENAEIYAKLEDDLREALGTKVSIKRENGDKGKLLIEYYSLDELERLIKIFQNGKEV